MGSIGSWGVGATIVTLLYVMALWLWENKWVILSALTVGLAIGYGSGR